MKQYSINVSKEAFLKFLVIENSRPQDMNRAQTFDYILRVFEESPIRIEICKELTKRNTISPGSASPLTDATRIIRGNSISGLVNTAPTKNNAYQEDKP